MPENETFLYQEKSGTIKRESRAHEPARGAQCWWDSTCPLGVTHRVSGVPEEMKQLPRLPFGLIMGEFEAQTWMCTPHAILTVEEEKAKGNTLIIEEL